LNLTGYIDESANEGGHLFTLSALVAERSAWKRFEVGWKNCVEKINTHLNKSGRLPISRYHASDCSSRVGEFAGWTTEEQKTLTKQLLAVFQAHNTKTFSYTVDLDALAEAFPLWKADPKKGAYDFLTAFLVREIGEWLGKRENASARIGLVHDRCQYGHTIKNSFQCLLRHPDFEHGRFFEAIESRSWQESVPLQAADLLAYESMKDAERRIEPRGRRTTLKLLLDLESFGIVAKYFGSGEIHGISRALVDPSAGAKSI
jgi:hypothetical protein